MTSEEMEKAQNVLKQQTCPLKRCKLTLLSQRYAVDIGLEKEEVPPLFYLIDTFLGQTRSVLKV